MRPVRKSHNALLTQNSLQTWPAVFPTPFPGGQESTLKLQDSSLQGHPSLKQSSITLPSMGRPEQVPQPLRGISCASGAGCVKPRQPGMLGWEPHPSGRQEEREGPLSSFSSSVQKQFHLFNILSKQYTIWFREIQQLYNTAQWKASFPICSSSYLSPTKVAAAIDLLFIFLSSSSSSPSSPSLSPLLASSAQKQIEYSLSPSPNSLPTLLSSSRSSVLYLLLFRQHVLDLLHDGQDGKMSSFFLTNSYKSKMYKDPPRWTFKLLQSLLLDSVVTSASKFFMEYIVMIMQKGKLLQVKFLLGQRSKYISNMDRCC